MYLNESEIQHRIQELMRDGVLSLILDKVKDDISKRIIQTSPDEGVVREEQYMLVQAINVLEMKLQEYVNIESQETNL